MTYFLTHWLFLLYGGLALAAWVSVRGHRDLWAAAARVTRIAPPAPPRLNNVRALGWALLAAWVLSNVTKEFLAFEWRPIIYPLIDLMIALTARAVYQRTRYRIAGVITLLSLANCAMNVAYVVWVARLADGTPLVDLRYAHTLSTNLIFASKCLLLTGWRIFNERGWSIGFGHLLRGDRRPVRSLGKRAGSE